MSFTPYDNSIRWYHDTYHQLKKWIKINNDVDITPVHRRGRNSNHTLSKEEKLYKRLLREIKDSYSHNIVNAYHKVNLKRLHLIQFLIDVNNEGNLLEVMEFLDPDTDDIVPDMHRNCTVIV